MTSAKVAKGNGYRGDRSGVEWSNALVNGQVGLSDAYTEKDIMATQRLIWVGGLYKRISPAILDLLEFRETLDTLKNISKPTKKENWSHL